MNGKKIKYYRLFKGITIEDLAKQIDCSKSAISLYENDLREPDHETLSKISLALDVNISKLIGNYEKEITFSHSYDEKFNNLSQREKDLLLLRIEDECAKHMTIQNILRKNTKKSYKPNVFSPSTNVEENATKIRKSLNISPFGPVFVVHTLLENLGFIILCFPTNETIDGLHGFVNKTPYVFVNANLKTIEQKRFVMLKQYCQLYFQDKLDNESINDLVGNALLPTNDLYDLFGKRNNAITPYLRNHVCKDYRVLPSLLVNRLFDAKIINEYYRNKFFLNLNKNIRKRGEQSLIDDNDIETTYSFQFAVYTALNKELISASKAAELLDVPLYTVYRNMRSD